MWYIVFHSIIISNVCNNSPSLTCLKSSSIWSLHAFSLNLSINFWMNMLPFSTSLRATQSEEQKWSVLVCKRRRIPVNRRNAVTSADELVNCVSFYQLIRQLVNSWILQTESHGHQTDVSPGSIARKSTEPTRQNLLLIYQMELVCHSLSQFDRVS